MQLEQTTVARLYALRDASASPGPKVLLLLARGAGAPPVLSLADAWSAYPSACFLFLDRPLSPAEEAPFAEAAWRYLSDASLKAVRFAWLAPESATRGLGGPTIALSSPDGGAAPATSRATSFDFRDLTLSVGMGCSVTFDASTGTVRIGQPDETRAHIRLASGWGSREHGVTGALSIPLTGPLAGCLQFALELTETAGVPDLAHLDVGLRSFHADPDTLPPPPPGAGATAVFLSSLRYPLLREHEAPSWLYANLDPLAVLDPSRTFFAFDPRDAGRAHPAPTAAVASYYCSTVGRRFDLLPASGASAPTGFARLVFAPRPLSDPPGPGDPLYLVPMGDFALQPATDGKGTSRLMNGLSGVEYVTVPPGAATYLCFYPGNPAHADGFVPGRPRAPGGVQLDGRATTSWACPAARGADGAPVSLTYHAQPDNAVLHHTDAAPSPDPRFLPLVYLEVPTEHLPATPAASYAFPLFPYSGVRAAALEPYRALEQEVFTSTRRIRARAAGAAAPPPAPAPGAASILAATPQGLLARFSADGEAWQALTLAESPGHALSLADIARGTPLRAALQTNQLFLVASDPAAIAAHLQAAAAKIAIAGWEFDFDPSTWLDQGAPAARGTLFILKFHDRGLGELARDTSLWTLPDAFNKSAPRARDTLSAIVAGARARAEADDDFAHFVGTVVDDPRWNGILVLNGCVKLDAIPAELRGVAAGINPSLFFAHHFGVSASTVGLGAGGALSIQSSSMFGLIHYETTGPLVDEGADYQFRVTLLKVLFASSLVSRFASKVELKIDRLFGEAATLEGGGGLNVVELFGAYQHHALPGGGSQGSYVFRTAEGASAVFDMDSKVLNAVEIREAQLITATPAAAGASSKTEARFVLRGTLDFVALDGLDLFSFGRDAGDSAPLGLSFANLAIDMTFDPDVPGSEAFTFDASQISFDRAGTRARAASLVQHFPMKLKGLTQAAAGVTPAGLGFLSVASPLRQSSLSYPWYSLDFDLDLGSLGALAAHAGLVATLTAAWAPGQSDYSVFLGLRLPGVSAGKRELSLEGIVKLGFGSVELHVDTSGGGTAYVLGLTNAALKLFNKTLPQSGHIDIVLFGDPDASPPTSSLGWYAAYTKDQG